MNGSSPTSPSRLQAARLIPLILMLALAGCQTPSDYYEAFTAHKFPAKASWEKIPVLYEEPKGKRYIAIGRYSTDNTYEPDEELQACAREKGADAIFVYAADRQLVTKAVYDGHPPDPPGPPSPRSPNDPPPTKRDIEDSHWDSLNSSMSHCESVQREKEEHTHLVSYWGGFLRAQFIVFLPNSAGH
jgi:hypothetical protein